MGLEEVKKAQREQRQTLSLWRSPLSTLRVFAASLWDDFLWLANYLVNHKPLVYAIGLFSMLSLVVLTVPGAHQNVYFKALDWVYLVLWWIVLGVLSSVGLGTGLHTFLLYLGPFIAQVTMAATVCKTTNFQRYGPDQFRCLHEPGPNEEAPSTFAIAQLVAMEAFLWGAGTAIGELPPYFVARQARLAGQELEELEDLSEAELEERRKEKENTEPSVTDRLTGLVDGFLSNTFTERGAVAKFFMIMLFASIPNPLFDLAGLTCGHLLVPFLGFFVPTLIGKAVIKVSLQTFFIIMVFNRDTLSILIAWIEKNIPSLQGWLTQKFDTAFRQFHRMPGESSSSEGKSSMAYVWDAVLAVMIGYFLVSIIHSKVQRRLLMEHKKEREGLERKPNSAKISRRIRSLSLNKKSNKAAEKEQPESVSIKADTQVKEASPKKAETPKTRSRNGGQGASPRSGQRSPRTRGSVGSTQ